MTDVAPHRALEIAWLGRIAYADALRRQEQRREAVIAGEAAPCLWLLEHDPVVTLGRRGGVVDRAALDAAGVPIVATSRGGLATVHNPGQLVGYLIVDVQRRRWRVPDVVAAVEEGLIRWLRARGVEAERRAGAPGVWLRGSGKVAAVGLHLRMGVSMHGFALNLRNDLALFGAVDPCGLGAGTAARASDVAANVPGPEAAWAAVGEAVAAALIVGCGDGGTSGPPIP